MNFLKTIWRGIRQEILKKTCRVFVNPFAQVPEHFFVIAPHPDDEVFGCGGLISLCPVNGKKAEILFLTDGTASHKGCCNEPESHIGARRRNLAKMAGEVMGVTQRHLHFLAGQDGSLPHKEHETSIVIATQIAEVLKKALPGAVFCPHPLEGWSDHIAATELTIAAIGLLPPESRPKLYYYCIWFWYNMPLKQAFRINWRQARLLDISEQLSAKQKAMAVYLDALAPCGYPWIGILPKEILRAFEWHKELFFEAE